MANPNPPAGGPPPQDYAHLEHYDFTTLQGLWIQAGGDPKWSVFAACVALAESGGNVWAGPTNSNGSVDRGLWQINSSHGAASSFDPLTNARAAIAISHNGTNWRPWCTAWSDNACGTKGGVYLGSGSSARAKYESITGSAIPSSTINSFKNTGNPITNIANAGSQILLGEPASQLVPDVSGTTGKVLRYALYGLEAAAGVALILLAVVLLGVMFYRKNPELAAAVPGVGEAAGAAGQLHDAATSRGTARKETGASAVRSGLRKGRAGKPSGAPSREPSERAAHERAIRHTTSVPGIETNPRPRQARPVPRTHRKPNYGGTGARPTQAEAGSPF